MKLLKLIPVLFVLTLFNTNSFAESKRDCSLIKADAGVKVFEKLRCEMGKEKGESLGTKFKKLFKKNN